MYLALVIGEERLIDTGFKLAEGKEKVQLKTHFLDDLPDFIVGGILNH